MAQKLFRGEMNNINAGHLLKMMVQPKTVDRDGLKWDHGKRREKQRTQPAKFYVFEERKDVLLRSRKILGRCLPRRERMELFRWTARG